MQEAIKIPDVGTMPFEATRAIEAYMENIHARMDCLENSKHDEPQRESKRVAEVEAEAEESQKPSARIKKSFGFLWSRSESIIGTSLVDQKIDAILAYLDEQYEKENHE